MQIEILDFVAGARAARGVAVVIDVFRAFSVACYAYAGGVERVIPIGGHRRLRWRMKRAHPEYLAIGERHGRKLEGFDFGNSPTEISQREHARPDARPHHHAGTQGLTNASQADVVSPAVS